MTAPTIVWFRRDLRLADNPALATAAAEGPVLPVYVLDETPGVRPIGAAGRWWLDKSLRALAADLARLGAPLVLRRGPAAEVLPALVARTGSRKVVWNRVYDTGAAARDAGLETELGRAGVAIETLNAALLVEPWTVRTGAGQPFKVFTPFWRAARARIDPGVASPAPPRLVGAERRPASDDIDAWRLHPTNPDWSGGFGVWSPGEAGALARLERFVDEGLAGYARARDEPAAEPGTSHLSPHLHWGEVGPRQVWRALTGAAERGEAGHAAVEKALSELAWREFNHQLLAQRPDLADVSVDPTFEAMAWRKAPGELEAWRRGETGYPIVDAGMRQLWRTGWMHNRVRMIVASFLVKDLLIDWREGERWFWDTLVDADEANNPANWQWVAGSGADASPFFRVFNPVAQGERFDKGGDYVRTWIPELAPLPDRWIHAPWTAPAAVLAEAGLVLGRDYPRPMVEHAAARARALEAFKALRARRGAADVAPARPAS